MSSCSIDDQKEALARALEHKLRLAELANTDLDAVAHFQVDLRTKGNCPCGDEEDKNINSTPCFSFIFISFIEWAEPIIENFFFTLIWVRFSLVLNDGKYTPSKSRFLANFKLFDK